MVIQRGKGGVLHVQQPLDLLRSRSLALEQFVVYNRSMTGERFMNLRIPKSKRELNPLDMVMKASILKTFKSVIKYRIDPFDEDIIHLLQEVATGIAPLFGGPHDEPLRHDE